ncbi:MAG: hypothetical protein ACKOBV_08265, partial [Candidatus Kapaibacterium sp.]
PTIGLLSALVGLLLTATVMAADISMEYFTTKADGNSVAIEWMCTTERAVARFEVERSTDGQTYRSVGVVEPRGAYQVYRFTDPDVLLKGGDTQQKVVGRSYSYRIRVVGTDNSSTYSSVSSLVHNVSSVRRTWGMIKEMFK